MFSPRQVEHALFMPPLARNFFVKSAVAWERVGARFAQGFSGVLVVEAGKEMTLPAGKSARMPAMRDLIRLVASYPGCDLAVPHQMLSVLILAAKTKNRLLANRFCRVIDLLIGKALASRIEGDSLFNSLRSLSSRDPRSR
jgi:hypothetical protein